MAEKKTAEKTVKKQTRSENVADKPATKRKKTTDESVACKQEARYVGDVSKKTNKPTSRKSTNTAQGKGRSGSRAINRETKPEKEPVKEPVKHTEDAARGESVIHAIIPWVLWALAFFSMASFLLIDLFKGVDAIKGVGNVGAWLRNFLCGLFGAGALLVPVVLAILAYVWQRAAKKNALLAKCFFALMTVLMPSALWHAVSHLDVGTWRITELWVMGVAFEGGGLLGGLLGEVLKLFGLVGSFIIGILGTAIFAVLLFGITPNYILTVIRYRRKLKQEARDRLSGEMMVDEQEARDEQRAAEAERKRRERTEQKQEDDERKRRERAEQKQEEDDRKRRERAEKYDRKMAKEVEKQEEKRRREEEKRRKAEEKRQQEEDDQRAKEIENSDTIFITPAESEDNKDKPVPADDKNDKNQKDSEGPVLIIPQKSEDDTKRPVKTETEKPAETDKNDKPVSDDDGVFLSAEALEAIRTRGKTEDDNFSLDEIFRNEKPLTKEEKNALGQKPQKENDAEGGDSSDVDMRLLTELKPITDIDEIPDLEDGIEEIAVEDEEKEREYVFPPIDLLAEDTNNHEEDVTAELMDNAQKLMDTLKSFKVSIKEITYSRGPTITRYELKPDAGIRVRSIANLVDDIALSLATTGVRIEAPIPNKPAVGIEVPNQNPSTVFLRSLIETEKFAGESSKLTACLGADVAGKPMYFNIAKMPHLLIAGATGMGKSVCINSIIVSLLYKARPDEVKLILIDPKKVEFNIYKDIPHLYAPIVSEPAKAAGALASAVAEMERRFELIEEVGVRDIYNYNAVTKDDPDREFMPQMVIIIDELADLMMTAPDAVESSICRLAQKARAAGIHIIIGTQRPSVDVITGLIKANVPSRIAFTVASQVDSRTIIDVAGAEKLIGRGDMLFAPVGAAKPMRVQGSFVHEREVEKVVEFIKANNCAAKYNDEFMSRIEEEAAKCTAGKKGSGGAPDGDVDSDGLDPKFREALKVAVESGRVATSLLQRKLEVGYGRAAKIIDQMEKMGYVSAPEGNKPRKLLISKEDFMQMTINDDI